MRTTLLALTVFATACTTLGPNPATTGVSAVPVGRPGVELTAGLAPAFYLSDAANDGDGEGAMTSQVSAMIEPDRLLGTKGLILGARSFGEDGDSPIEPMVGYRRKLNEAFSLGGVVFGGRASGEQNEAFYKATRAGGEITIDGGIASERKWLALHLFASLSATYLNAKGEYCIADNGVATDCDDYSTRVDGAVEGIYTAGSLGLALDIARRPQGTIQSVRLQLHGAVGAMPALRYGEQIESNNGFFSMGLGLSLGFGSPD